MRKEIEQTLLSLQIESKETRKKTARNIAVVLILALIFYLIPYFYPELAVLMGIDILIGIFGGLYIVLDAIPTLYQPLKEESYAFQRIARAVEILEKSNKPIAYEEAYRCLKHAHKILKNTVLNDLEWYKKINQTLNRFLENLELVVLPAIASSKIKKEHLEEIALALSSIKPSEIDAINERLETNPNYKKAEPPPKKMEIFTKKIRESTYAFGLALLIGCCIFYYTVVNYLETSNEYAVTISVTVFFGILTIYLRKQLR